MIRVFGHYVRWGLLLLIVLEVTLLVIGGYAGIALYTGFSNGSAFGVEPLANGNVWALAVPVMVVFALMLSFGLYRAENNHGLGEELTRLLSAFGIGFGILAVLVWLDDGRLLPDLPIGAGLITAALALTAFRVFMHEGRGSELLQQRVLVLGTGTRAAKVDELVSKGLASGVDVVGYLPADDSRIHEVAPGRILQEEMGRPLAEVIARNDIDEVVVAIRDRRGKMPIRDLLDCRLRGVKVTDVSSFFEREKGQLRLESLNAGWLIFSEGFRRNRWRLFVKRTFDLSVSTALLLAALPIMLLTAVAILAESGRPVFYKQERIGEGGRVFLIRKFRSMRQDAERDGQAQWAATDDDRVTRVGRVIRFLRIDELPQALNILKGDMSFVGPRPERPMFVDQLSEQIPFYNSRHSIKPGLTGWAQVRYAYGASVEDAVEKLQFDLYYVKNHTLFLDMLILFETVRVVLFGKGAR